MGWIRACLKADGTEPVAIEWLIMVSMDGLTASITSFRNGVGSMSRLQDEDFICAIVLLSNDRVIG